MIKCESICIHKSIICIIFYALIRNLIYSETSASANFVVLYEKMYPFRDIQTMPISVNLLVQENNLLKWVQDATEVTTLKKSSHVHQIYCKHDLWDQHEREDWTGSPPEIGYYGVRPKHYFANVNDVHTWLRRFVSDHNLEESGYLSKCYSIC